LGKGGVSVKPRATYGPVVNVLGETSGQKVAVTLASTGAETSASWSISKK
jgi:hypothetical protein